MRLHNLIHLIVFSCVSGITHFHNAPTSHQQGLVNRATERQPGGPECQKAQIPSPKNCQTLSRIAECLQKYANNQRETHYICKEMQKYQKIKVCLTPTWGKREGLLQRAVHLN